MSNGSAATVTLLFTDLVRSTAQWERYPHEMSEAVAIHDELVRAVVGSYGGRVFATGGDGFCVVFASPSAGVAAAAETQRRLAATVWPAGVQLRARMGLHTGEVEERGGDYFGPAVNRVARLTATAHGGQVVVSAVTASLARDRLPAGLGLVDVGRHRLKDLARPEHVFQLSVDGLEAVFPALRSLDGSGTNLPAARTSFVGRVAEVRELVELVRTCRLVTVTGAGGSGKTRLAIEVGRAVLSDFPDGVWFVDLSSITDGDLVVGAVANALGLAGDDGDSVHARVVGPLVEWRCLLVVDNCEQVLDAAAELVDMLLSSCAGLKVLATSREPLGVSGEQVWRVPGLALSSDDDAPSDALSLFVDRVRLADAAFVPDRHQRRLIASVCRRLDGLPLAIELAAARVDSLGIEEVADRLDDMFTVLTGGRRRTGRQYTLRASIAWSYDLLSPSERTLLQTLSVFSGGFTLSAAEGVAVDDTVCAGDVAGLLGHLVEQSLVVADHSSTGIRYRLLETIRAFAADALTAAGRDHEVRDRHLAWYASWSYALAVAPANWSALVFSRSDVDNQRRAAQWAIHRHDPRALARLLVDAVGGLAACQLTEATHYLEVLDSYRSQLDAVDRDRLAFGQAAAGTIAGRFADVVQICERHREIAVDDLMWPKFVFLLSFTSAWVDPDRALALLDEIEERAGPSPMAAYGRATVALTNRRYDDAIEMILTILDVTELNQLETAEAFRRPGGNPLGHVLQALATGLHLVDRNDEATAILAHAVEVGTDLFQHYPTVLAAVIHAAQADHHTARELLALSVATVQHAAIPLGSSDCAIAAAALAYRTGHPHLASDTLAAVRAVRGFRTEASVALYRGYVDLTRLALGDVQRRPDVRPIDEALDHALHALNISPA